MTSRSNPLALLGILLMACHSVSAEDLTSLSPLLKPSAAAGATWQVSASPYVWASGLRGDIGQPGQSPVRLDVRFGKVINHLDLAFMGAIEARHQRFSLVGDIVYARLSTRVDNHAGVLSRHIDITSKSFSGFAGAGYSVLANDTARLDVIAGGRLWYASTETDLTGGLLNGRGTRDSATWINAVAGLRGRTALSERWYFTGWGIVGAGQAKLDWDVTAAFGYTFKHRFSAVAGYRALGVNYQRNGFVYDVIQHGPMLGLTYRF